jgi:hypothetical protein
MIGTLGGGLSGGMARTQTCQMFVFVGKVGWAWGGSAGVGRAFKKLNKMRYRQASSNTEQGAGHPVQGAGNPEQGAGNPEQGRVIQNRH